MEKERNLYIIVPIIGIVIVILSALGVDNALWSSEYSSNPTGFEVIEECDITD